jgi:GTP cyclohydrolase I
MTSTRNETMVLGPAESMVDIDAAASAAGDFIKALGVELTDEASQNTPRRMAEAYAELFNAKSFVARTFESESHHNGAVVVTGIAFESVCEHHLLPFVGHATLSYRPAERVIGLSKLARAVRYFAARPQLQERLTAQLAEWLQEATGATGAAACIKASHTCLTLRGAKAESAEMTTTCLRGEYETDPMVRQEFMLLYGAGK